MTQERKKQHSHSIWVFLGQGSKEHLPLMLEFSQSWQIWAHFPQASIALRIVTGSSIPTTFQLPISSISFRFCYYRISLLSPFTRAAAYRTAFLSYPAPPPPPRFLLSVCGVLWKVFQLYNFLIKLALSLKATSNFKPVTAQLFHDISRSFSPSSPLNCISPLFYSAFLSEARSGRQIIIMEIYPLAPEVLEVSGGIRKEIVEHQINVNKEGMFLGAGDHQQAGHIH